MIRHLKFARDIALKSRTQAVVTLNTCSGTELAVGSAHLDDAEVLRCERPDQARAIAARTLDADCVHDAMATRAVRELTITIRRRRRGDSTQPGPQSHCARRGVDAPLEEFRE